MKQVSISMVQVSWLKDLAISKTFFSALIDSGNLEIFKNQNMIEMIRYMWDICHNYFVFYRFLPFLLLLYLPLQIFTFIPLDTEDKTWSGVQLGCLFLTVLYLLSKLWS